MWQSSWTVAAANAATNHGSGSTRISNAAKIKAALSIRIKFCIL